MTEAFHPSHEKPVELKVPGELIDAFYRIGLDHKLKEAALIPGVVKNPLLIGEGIREEWDSLSGDDDDNSLCYMGAPDKKVIRGWQIKPFEKSEYFLVFVNPRQEIFEWGREKIPALADLEERFGRIIWRRNVNSGT